MIYKSQPQYMILRSRCYNLESSEAIHPRRVIYYSRSAQKIIPSWFYIQFLPIVSSDKASRFVTLLVLLKEPICKSLIRLNRRYKYSQGMPLPSRLCLLIWNNFGPFFHRKASHKTQIRIRMSPSHRYQQLEGKSLWITLRMQVRFLISIPLKPCFSYPKMSCSHRTTRINRYSQRQKVALLRMISPCKRLWLRR
jgi:hypothetical protein